VRDALLITAVMTSLLGAPSAFASPDWGKVPARKINVFYPGVASMEWVLSSSDHGGARAVRKGETCASCHEEESGEFAKKIVSGQKAEPNPDMAKGRAASIPVTVQAAIDDGKIYLRFQWKPIASGTKKFDEKSVAKITVMLDAGKVEYGAVGGCWATCHDDLRSMPDVSADAPNHPRAKELDIRSNGPTKYLKETRTEISMTKPRGGWDKLKPAADYEAMMKDGKFMEMWQWRSGDSVRAGTVSDARRLKATKDLAEGKLENGIYTVVFTRKLAGGPGMHELSPGKTYNIGFAIHDDYADFRFHQVSLGYTLGIDAKADISAAKQ
jgi:Ethylbenzene dehydrogenase